MASLVDANKNRDTLNDFADYCFAHPELRFWQALRNWCGFNFVCVTDDGFDDKQRFIDTFYWKGKTK
jgi:hypothetical protein